MSELINNSNESVMRVVANIDKLTKQAEAFFSNYRPPMKDERYLTDKQLSERLHISRRTLQEWRTTGKIGYIIIGGKTIYRESDIEKLLQENYNGGWR